MIVLWVVLAFMAICAAALIVRPFLMGASGDAVAPGADAGLNAELRDIETSIARGDMDSEAAASAKIDAERRFLRAKDQAAVAPTAPPERRGAAVIAAIVVIGAIGLYAMIGRPDMIDPPPTQEQSAQAELDRLIGTLEQRLKASPNDPEGWRALGWAYFINGRYDDAGGAYQRAIALRANEPAYHSAYGEAIVGQAKGKVSPEALAEFQRALKLDPHDVRARFYLGLKKAQSGDAKSAIQDWLALYDEAPAGSDAQGELRKQIETLAAQANIDVSSHFQAAGPSAADVDNASKMSDAERDAMINAMVESLDQRLRQNPNDLEGWTKLIRARAVQKKPAEAADALKRARAAFKGDVSAQKALDQAAAEANLR